jgi:hypothetical protein
MSVGEDRSHASLIGHINEELYEGVRRVPVHGEGAEGKPEPHDRPDAHAQWDEVEGQWIEWDEATQKWIPAPDQTALPATAGSDTAPAAADEATEPPAEQ